MSTIIELIRDLDRAITDKDIDAIGMDFFGQLLIRHRGHRVPFCKQRLEVLGEDIFPRRT